MAIRNYIPIDTYDLPESFEYALDGTTYLFTVNYNDEGDFFTIDIDDQNGHVLRGEKLVLNVPLFSSYYYEWLPTTPLIPMDESGQATYCGIQELGETVFMYEDTVNPDDIAAGTLPINGDIEGGLDDDS